MLSVPEKGRGRVAPGQRLKAMVWKHLPANARAYVKALEDMSGAPISTIGVGPGRTETNEVNSFL